MPNLGEHVRRRRVQLALTQEEAAERAGISPTTWRNIELGSTTPRKRSLRAVAEVLETDVETLLRAGPLGFGLRAVIDGAESATDVHSAVEALRAFLLDPADLYVPHDRLAFILVTNGMYRVVAAAGQQVEGLRPEDGPYLPEEPHAWRHEGLGSGLTLVTLEPGDPKHGHVQTRLVEAGFRAAISIDVTVGGRLAGSIALSARDPRAFDGVDLHALAAYGEVSGHALLALAALEQPPDAVVHLATKLAALPAESRETVLELVEQLSLLHARQRTPGEPEETDTSREH